MERDALLIELGCEEIPARMIDAAAADLAARVLAILDRNGLAHGDAEHWGGMRRLAVRVGDVQARQADRDEQLLGPPVSAGLDADGKPTKAAIGFAKKQGIGPEELRPIDTDRGTYLGFDRHVEGRGIGAVLAAELEAEVAAIPFPKSMRWGAGEHRWVRPLQWVVALHGHDVLELQVFGVPAGRHSLAHRFLAEAPAELDHPGEYLDVLREGFVWVDPAQRRDALASACDRHAGEAGGRVVPDEGLLREIVQLVEMPGIVCGEFDEAFLQLPRELLITTLRHHQKCFSIERSGGDLANVFLAVANTDRDPGGHIQRGNEWVVGGRLEDARFFWNEDRKRPLADRAERLGAVVEHRAIGTYADKAARLAALAGKLCDHLGVDEGEIPAIVEAARLAKVDLVTGTVGEFPELQGRVGGLLLRAEGASETTASAIYEHYLPEGPTDDVPGTEGGVIVALADKLDSIHRFISAVERPTGSRDPFGLRRATNGLYRVLVERRIELSLDDLATLVDGHEETVDYLRERLTNYLRERGAAVGEIRSVVRTPTSDPWPIHEIASRLDAIRRVRSRADFDLLVDLTKRVDNILTKNADKLGAAVDGFTDGEPAAVELASHADEIGPRIRQAAEEKRFDDIVDALAGFVAPVERFFDKVLVIDPDQPAATAARGQLLTRLRDVLIADYDIRELAGEAERR